MLIDLYERNFKLLQRLIPALDLPPQKAISHTLADPPLHLQVTERDRYTLTCKLTYEFVDDKGVRNQPDLWVRIYRDACVAEALNQPNRPPGRPKMMVIRGPSASLTSSGGAISRSASGWNT